MISAPVENCCYGDGHLHLFLRRWVCEWMAPAVCCEKTPSTDLSVKGTEVGVSAMPNLAWMRQRISTASACAVFMHAAEPVRPLSAQRRAMRSILSSILLCHFESFAKCRRCPAVHTVQVGKTNFGPLRLSLSRFGRVVYALAKMCAHASAAGTISHRDTLAQTHMHARAQKRSARCDDWSVSRAYLSMAMRVVVL